MKEKRFLLWLYIASRLYNHMWKLHSSIKLYLKQFLPLLLPCFHSWLIFAVTIRIKPEYAKGVSLEHIMYGFLLPGNNLRHGTLCVCMCVCVCLFVCASLHVCVCDLSI